MPLHKTPHLIQGVHTCIQNEQHNLWYTPGVTNPKTYVWHPWSRIVEIDTVSVPCTRRDDWQFNVGICPDVLMLPSNYYGFPREVRCDRVPIWNFCILSLNLNYSKLLLFVVYHQRSHPQPTYSNQKSHTNPLYQTPPHQYLSQFYTHCIFPHLGMDHNPTTDDCPNSMCHSQGY